MSLLEGLLAVDNETLLNVLRLKASKDSEIDEFEQMEVQFSTAQTGHVATGEHLEETKPSFDDAIYAVQKAAEDARMAESALQDARSQMVNAMKEFEACQSQGSTPKQGHSRDPNNPNYRMSFTSTVSSVTQAEVSPSTQQTMPMPPAPPLVGRRMAGIPPHQRTPNTPKSPTEIAGYFAARY